MLFRSKDEDIHKLQEELEVMTVNYNALKLQQLMGPSDNKDPIASDEEENLPRNQSIESDMADEEDALREKVEEQEMQLMGLRKEMQRVKEELQEKEREGQDKEREGEELVERLKQELFCSIAVGIKLNFSMQGHPCNKNIGALYELCCNLNIPRHGWNAWIHKQLEQ